VVRAVLAPVGSGIAGAGIVVSFGAGNVLVLSAYLAQMTGPRDFAAIGLDAARRDERIAHPDAFDLTMRGRALSLRSQEQPTNEGNNAARAMYEQALAIDQNNAGALAGEAGTYMVDMAFGWTDPATDYDAKILGQVDRSIALVREDPLPYVVKSLYLTVVRRLDEGIRAANAGLAFNPNSARLHAARGHAGIYIGLFEQGKTDIEKAMRLSPRDPGIGGWHIFLCLAELGLGHYDAAINDGNRAFDAGYRIFLVHAFLAAAHALKGDTPRAKTALAEARRLNSKLTVKMMAERYANITVLLEGLRKAGLPEE
jgi:adenylate cyclase